VAWGGSVGREIGVGHNPAMASTNDSFVGVVSIVFGVLAWAQMPALCGFMFSSTRVGAENYIYSIWLGALIAVIGLASAVPSILKGSRHVLILAGAAASAGFIATGLLAQGWYGSACRAVFMALSPT
jgi:hypothetical protein